MADNDIFYISSQYTGQYPTLGQMRLMGPDYTFVTELFHRQAESFGHVSRGEALVQLYLYQGQVVVAKTACTKELAPELLHATANVPWAGVTTIFTEFANGGSIEDLFTAINLEIYPGKPSIELARYLMPEELLWHIAVSIFDGMIHMRSQNLRHRDLHFSNILLQPHPDDPSRFPQVKIIDFGLMLPTRIPDRGPNVDYLHLKSRFKMLCKDLMPDDFYYGLVDPLWNPSSPDEILAACPHARQNAVQTQPMSPWLQAYFQAQMDGDNEAIAAAKALVDSASSPQAETSTLSEEVESTQAEAEANHPASSPQAETSTYGEEVAPIQAEAEANDPAPTRLRRRDTLKRLLTRIRK